MEKRTVLVADDDCSVRKLIAAILTHDGYRVLEAKDGSEALQIAKGTNPDLVITDVIMPGMSGPELILHLKELNLVGRFLLISGYSGDALDTIHGLHDRIAFLQKPFSGDRLTASIRELLTDFCVPERYPDLGHIVQAA